MRFEPASPHEREEQSLDGDTKRRGFRAGNRRSGADEFAAEVAHTEETPGLTFLGSLRDELCEGGSGEVRDEAVWLLFPTCAMLKAFGGAPVHAVGAGVVEGCAAWCTDHESPPSFWTPLTVREGGNCVCDVNHSTLSGILVRYSESSP